MSLAEEVFHVTNTDTFVSAMGWGELDGEYKKDMGRETDRQKWKYQKLSGSCRPPPRHQPQILCDQKQNLSLHSFSDRIYTKAQKQLTHIDLYMPVEVILGSERCQISACGESLAQSLVR